MIVLTAVLFLHLLIGRAIEELNLKALPYFFTVVLFAVLMVFTVGITNTADWNMYYHFFKYEVEETDFTYYRLSVLFHKYHLSFEDLFVFHIVLSALLTFFLVSRFTRNVFYVLLIYYLLDYVHVVNQIRYYLGFPILTLGFYYLFIQKRYILAIGLIAISLLTHIGLLFLLLFIPLYYFVKPQKYLKTVSLLSVLIFAIVFIISKTGLGTVIEHFGSYLEREGISSFLGGFLSGIPYFLFIPFLLIISRKIDFTLPEYNTPQFIFLYKITFMSVIFIPSALILQIIGFRYIKPTMIFWFIYFLYITKQQSSNKVRSIYFVLFFILAVTSIFATYYLKEMILGSSGFEQESEVILKSIKYLRGIIND